MRTLLIASLLLTALSPWSPALAAAPDAPSLQAKAGTASPLYYYFEAPPESAARDTFEGTFVTFLDDVPFAATDFSFGPVAGDAPGVTVLAVSLETARELRQQSGAHKIEVELQIDGRAIHRFAYEELLQLNRELKQEAPQQRSRELVSLFAASTSCDADACRDEFHECKMACHNSGDPECLAECSDIYNQCMYCCFDADGDGVLNCDDNCRDVANSGQEDCDGDNQGDACDPTISDLTPLSAASACQIELSDHFGYFRVKLWGVQDATSGCIAGTCTQQVLLQNDKCYYWQGLSARECCDSIWGQLVCDTFIGGICNPTCPQ